MIEQFAMDCDGVCGQPRGRCRRSLETAQMDLLVCSERISGMTSDGAALKQGICSTTVFRKQDGHCKVVHHHTDRF